MAYANDTALDAALNWIKTNGTVLHICTSEPATYGAIAAAQLASEAVTITGPADGDVSGRKITVPSVSADDVDTTGTATHWALSNGTDTLVATGDLSASAELDSAGTYTTAAFAITLPDFT